MNDDESLRRAVLSEGYALEWRTAEVFRQLSTDVRQNVIFDTFDPQEGYRATVEVDVLASIYHSVRSHVFVVECKGASSSDVLTLIEGAESFYSANQPRYFLDNRVCDLSSTFTIAPNATRGPSFSVTGDFFRRNEKSYVKASKQDEKSNLFKGITQLIAGLDAAFDDYKRQGSQFVLNSEVMPMIVTNAKIKIVRFKKPGESVNLAQPTIESIPWVMHQNSVGFGWSNFFRNIEWKNRSGAERRFPYIWIVNIEYLNEFITRQGNFQHPVKQ